MGRDGSHQEIKSCSVLLEVLRFFRLSTLDLSKAYNLRSEVVSTSLPLLCYSASRTFRKRLLLILGLTVAGTSQVTRLHNRTVSEGFSRKLSPVVLSWTRRTHALMDARRTVEQSFGRSSLCVEGRLEPSARTRTCENSNYSLLRVRNTVRGTFHKPFSS